MLGRSANTLAFIFVLILVGFSSLQALSQAYFGQEPPGKVPEVFAPGIVSLDGDAGSEYAPCFWPDGLRCIFPRFGKGIPDGTIFESKLEKSGWTAPASSALFPNGAFEPSLSPDGQRIFYAPPDFSARHGTLVLQMMQLGSDGWGDPIPLFRGLFASADMEGTLYYTTFYRNKDHVAYRVCEDGEYGPETLLEANVFSAQHEDAHPSIAPDGSYLIFDSETRTRPNACWLFITFRNDDGSWTEPVHMGSVLGDLSASLARITPDGEYIFFKANGDVYWVDAAVIDSLR
ncbi:hypothetical protein ACFLS0_05275 [Candidatus Bipolaricaulota bacterium]